ncbi:MAG: PAS domain S-box protein [Deltaproteobacteria bacterium]|nr:PAS domain S-box protein [Deltaproteobacteria bacterium]
MNKLEEIEKKNQGLKEKNQRLMEAASDLKKENARIAKEFHEKSLLFNDAPAGICLLWRGRIIEVNDTFLDYMGYRADEMINRNFLNFVRYDHLSEVRFMHNRWNAGKISRGHYDTWLVRENGESIFCSIESKRIRFRGKASYLLNITRLEERAEGQEKLHLKIRKEAEIKMTGVLHSLLIKRSDAVLEMLRFIRGSKDINRSDFKEIASRLRQEQEIIRKETWMLDVIAKEKEEVQEKKFIEINRIIKEALTRREGLLKKGSVTIKSYLRATSSVNGNPGELVEAICELISYLHAKVSNQGEIHITTEEDQERIIIYFQDNAPFSGDETAHVSGPFTPQKTILTDELGMSFVKAVILRHNGEIEYMPGRGEGNFYQITLPAFKEDKKRRKIDLNRIKHARILIIKNSDIAKELLIHMLIEKGCTVETVEGSMEGVLAIKKRRINMVVADMDGPGMNNSSFWKKCREINPKLITVGLMEMKNAAGHSHMIERNPDLIIPKPYNIKEAVRNILELFMVMYE